MQPWLKPPAMPVQNEAEVHVWRATLDRPPKEVETYRSMLSPDELLRAERLIFPEHRRRFIVARGSLRSILARYLAIAPAAIRFEYGPHGKPRLDTSHVLAHPLHFNLTHSNDLALFSVTGLGAIGIDIEQIRPDFSSAQIAKRYFSAGEIEALGMLAPQEYAEAFFRCWTRKEAFIKATGLGLSLPLDQFDVTLNPGETASLLRTAWDPGEAAHWSLRTLEAG
jgi:4'-phosphopantetheinyl transferase